jgi:hypothetical protein
MALGKSPRPRKVQSELLSAALRLFGRVPLIPGRGAPLVPSHLSHPRQSRQYRHQYLTLYSRPLARVSTLGSRSYHILLPRVRLIYSTQAYLPITSRVLNRPRNPENPSGFPHQSRVSSCICGSCIIIHQEMKPRTTITSAAVAYRVHTRAG